MKDIRFSLRSFFAVLAIHLLTAMNGLPLFADAPLLVNYQGKLADSGGNPQNGTFDMTFRIYDTGPGAGGSLRFQDAHTGGAHVTVANGVFNVLIGGGNTAGSPVSLSAALQENATRWLEVQVGATVLTPRQRLGASPFALAVAPDSVNTLELKDGAVTNPKIGVLAVMNANVNDVAAGKVTAGSFTTGNYVYPGTMTVSGLSQFGGVSRSTFTSGGALNMASGQHITFSGNGEVRGLPATPGASDAAASKGYVDSAAANANLWSTAGVNIFRNTAVGIGVTAVANGTLVVRSTTVTVGNPVLNIQNNGGAELMRVQQDGSVGVGTAGPNIAGFGGGTIMTLANSASTGGVLELASTGSDGAGKGGGELAFSANANTGGKRIAYIHGETEGSTANNRGGNLQFATKADNGNLFERMRITPTGNVGIGTGNPKGILHLKPSGNLFSTGSMLLESSAGGSVYALINSGNTLYLGYNGDPGGGFPQASYSSRMYFLPSGTAVFPVNSVGIGMVPNGPNFHVSGSIGATDWVGAGCETGCEGGGGYALMYPDGTIVSSNGSFLSSDERLKKNIRPLEGGALDDMLRLRGVMYEWKEVLGHSPGTQVGVIAQEVEKVFPQWVREGPGGYKTVALTSFDGLVIEAFRQLKAENDTLKKEIEELKNKIEAGGK